MTILIYRNQLLQDATMGAYFCDICNPLVVKGCVISELILRSSRHHLI